MNILIAMIPAFFWGTTYAVTQATLADWPPLLLGALRALPAGLLLLLVKPMLPNRRQVLTLIKLGTINIAAFFALIFVMALTLPSAISGVGMISVPVFAMLFHWIVAKQAPSKVQALCGFGLISFAWFLFDPSHLALNPIGLLAMLSAIFCIIIGSRITKSLGTEMHWWLILTWQLIFGGIVLSLASFAQFVAEPTPYYQAWEQLDGKNLIGLGWIILMNTALGYGLYVWLLQRMSVVDFTFGGIANPVAGIVCGVLLVGESYTLHQFSLMAGMILMSLLPQIVGLLSSKKRQKRQEVTLSLSDS
ncbi:EamA family transporter [Vibrio vulnificus]|nr:EamA family transporter [Vibrio vulnificus]EHH2474521.1 EamA family transporter [Vibrio vulnificus]EHU5129029.1 EamA family transporter [Vibrio vulnificus]